MCVCLDYVFFLGGGGNKLKKKRLWYIYMYIFVKEETQKENTER